MFFFCAGETKVMGLLRGSSRLGELFKDSGTHILTLSELRYTSDILIDSGIEIPN